MKLGALNDADQTSFVEALSGVFENADWVAEQAWELRPFPTVTALHQTLFDQVADAEENAQTEFLNGHPELAASRLGMGAHSAAEQDSLGLDDAAALRLRAMNEAYRARFGFPFLICVRRHTRLSLLTRFERRLHAEPAAELQAALQEVFLITRLRLAGLVDGPGMPTVSGGLSTHVLDTAAGRPGAGVRVELFAMEEAGPVRVREGITDAQGRVSDLLDDGGPLRIGAYELRFHVGAYFAGAGMVLPDPPFLDVVPVRIGIAEAESHYHVPLLVSPFGCTTYRGS